MQEFKVGDRVRLEGVISRLWGEGGAWVNFTGSDEETGVTREEMAHATLIEPAVKAADEKVLDLSKPVRIKVRPGVEVREVFGPSSRGFCLVDRADGILDIRLLEELENIPESKSVTGNVVLIKGSDELWLDSELGKDDRVTARARITHTSGEGWSIEEVK